MRAVLFDFFGTLVAYSPSRVAQGYPRSHALVPGWPYDEFLAALDATFATFDARSAADGREFAMVDVTGALLGRPPSDPLAAELARVYVEEWAAGVTAPDGLPALFATLRERHRLAIVSNTHSSTMVPRFLDRLGLTAMVDAVVLSVDVGWCKPHPAVYAAALDALAVAPADAVFVGDTYAADYAGPVAAGMRAYLIDPAGAAPVPADRRITSVFDLPGLL